MYLVVLLRVRLTKKPPQFPGKPSYREGCSIKLETMAERSKHCERKCKTLDSFSAAQSTGCIELRSSICKATSERNINIEARASHCNFILKKHALI